MTTTPTRLATPPYPRARLLLLASLGLLAGLAIAWSTPTAYSQEESSDGSLDSNGDTGAVVLEAHQQPPVPRILTPRVEHVDTYHGMQVADPYRWLEDARAPQTESWVALQNAHTQAHLARIPGRDRLTDRLTALYDRERFGLPSLRHGRVTYSYNDGLMPQSVLMLADGPEPDADARVLLDPNTFSEDGTKSLAGTSISPDGRYLAYGVSESGSDWRTWHVLEIDSGETLPDVIAWCKFSNASWVGTSERSLGFHYTSYDPPAEIDGTYADVNTDPKLRYHALGTDPADDPVVFQNDDDPLAYVSGGMTRDQAMLLIYTGRRRDGSLFVQFPGSAAPLPVFEHLEKGTWVIETDGTQMWVSTSMGAPNGRLVRIDAERPGTPETWETLIAERDVPLENVTIVGDQILCEYLIDGSSAVERFTLEGEPLGPLALPGVGTMSGLSGELGHPYTFFSFMSLTRPSTAYRYDLATGAITTHRESTVDFDASRYETSRVFFESQDGTRVPMFLAHRRGIERDGTNPTLLYGYGGFNVAMSSYFSTTYQLWMEMGGVVAVALLRGGSEYGEAWHEAGMLGNKQNVYDDFIAAAKWLSAEGYASREHLAIRGGSNGGTLVGAVLNQRPDLFAAAVPAVGVMDMLRYHRFTIGHSWIPEYGSADNPDQFGFLLAYSPYHNIRSGFSYPPTMVMTSDHDDRVVPAHSYKYAARLQANQLGDNPILLRVETSGGHGAGLPTAKRIAQTVDWLAFIAHHCGATIPTWERDTPLLPDTTTPSAAPDTSMGAE